MEERERERVGREEWAKRVERWADSGLTASEFAAELGINPRTLSYWKWVLKRDASSPGAKRSPRRANLRRREAAVRGSGLIEIQARPSETSFELELEGGRKVRVPSGFDADGLRRLLSVLEAR
jgi:transposase-like protein